MIKVIFIKLFLEIASLFAPSKHLIVETATGMEISSRLFSVCRLIRLSFSAFLLHLYRRLQGLMSKFWLRVVCADNKQRLVRHVRHLFMVTLSLEFPPSFPSHFTKVNLQVATCWHCNLTPQLKLFAYLWFHD